MSIDRDPAVLIDIANASRLVQDFTKGHDKIEFGTDLLLQSAVLHQLLVLGEAVRRLTAEFRAAHPEVDWRGYVGLRNLLIHKYDEIDLDEIWKIASDDVPALSRQIIPWLPDETF